MITKYDKNCAICGRPTTTFHHLCFGNAYRRLSEEDGLKIPICAICHEELHHNTVACELSRICGQLAYEKQIIEREGLNSEQARECFRKRYNRSYL